MQNTYQGTTFTQEENSERGGHEPTISKANPVLQDPVGPTAPGALSTYGKATGSAFLSVTVRKRWGSAP